MIQVGLRTLLASTCRGCGELRQGHEFKMSLRGRDNNKKHYRNSECYTCHRRRISKQTKDANAEALDKATSHYNPWTDRDLTELAFLTQMGHSAREIAEKLNRTISSVYNARQRLEED